ncbi:short coiled-coil protein B-like [Liolophura sinensis]|uniref:short coiled-coil protein B-like n=1 Tax=Liolophura sinensis TaxID=3198878 RepID=UPI0031586DB5
MKMSNKEELSNIPLTSDSESGEGDVHQRPGDIDSNRLEGLTNGTSGHILDPDINPDEEEEKHRLITQVLELQNTLDDLSSRVDSVKEENLKLKSENQVLGQYIENLMAASSVFQSTSPKTKKK